MRQKCAQQQRYLGAGFLGRSQPIQKSPPTFRIHVADSRGKELPRARRQSLLHQYPAQVPQRPLFASVQRYTNWRIDATTNRAFPTKKPPSKAQAHESNHAPRLPDKVPAVGKGPANANSDRIIPGSASILPISRPSLSVAPLRSGRYLECGWRLSVSKRWWGRSWTNHDDNSSA